MTAVAAQPGSAGAIVIIGAGRAGAAAAATLRAEGYPGRITLVGDEELPPYDRPPLSKDVLLGQAEPLDGVLHPPAFYVDQGIELLAGDAALAIERERRQVRLTSGRMLPYDRLLLATGSRARRLTLDAASAARVHYLRTAGDAAGLRERLARRPCVVLLGGGVIGLEAAAAAVALGCTVSVVEAAPRVMSRVLPQRLSELLQAEHRAHGVRVLTGRSPARIEGEGSQASAVVLADGERLPAGVVVAGIGATPETALAQAAGLAVDDGIVTDARCRTSDPCIFAAGDCARSQHPLLGRALRVESWQHAGQQGSAAALAMLDRGEDQRELPWMWSDQYDLNIQSTGVLDDGDQLVLRDQWSSAASVFGFALRQGCLRGAVALSRGEAPGRDIRLAQLLIAQGKSVDAVALGDPAVRLKALLKA